MGCGSSASAASPDEVKESKAIERSLAKDVKELRKTVKLLMLGPGDSGKSTLVKQFKVLFLQGYTADERRAFHNTINLNVLEGVRQYSIGCRRLGLKVDPSLQSAYEFFVSLPSEEELTPDLAADIKALWADPAFKQADARKHEFQVDGWASYFLDDIDRLMDPNYVPTQRDIIRSRVRTTGISEMKFGYQNVTFRIMDVGGQRTERRKWIHCFEDVTAVIFVVALSEFDQRLFEDESKWRMEESLDLFKWTFDNEFLQRVSFILFFNKTDIFAHKINVEKRDPSICFPAYTAGPDEAKAREFIKTMFVNSRSDSRRDVFPHFTCADDTSQVKVVFEASQQIILKQNLIRTGLS